MAESSDQDLVVNQCPECSSSVNVTSFSPFSKIECPHCGSSVRVKRYMGPYEITGILGEGGMSQVFRAVDTHLGREVALKVLHSELSQDSALTSMFEREAKLTASVLHPNVVKVYTVGQDQGFFYIAMELVRATSLEEMIANKGALSESDVLHIAHDVTRGLAAAREEGLIHRDIKPGNMLVTEDGTAKLVDFGLAVQQGGEDESEDLWATPFYVPPEKLDGEKDTYLGDIYSLGATFYHALAGKPPFDANTSSLEELKVIKRQELDLRSQVAGLSKATVRLIEKMMSYEAANRPQSHDEILDHIETIQKRQFGITRSSRRSQPANRRALLALGACSALLAVVIVVNLFRDDEVSGGAGIGIQTDDRVISEGDNTNTAQFLEGRDLLARGDFRQAEQIFDSLVTETSLSPSIRMWSLFFQGTARMFRGDEESARRSFGMIDAIETESEGGLAERGLEEIDELMSVSARALSGPLPVLEAESLFSGDSVESIGLFAAGLKNWQLGQFESGLAAMSLFEKSIIPEEYEWMVPLQGEVKRFRGDFARFSNLPNPSRESKEALNPQRKALEEVLPQMKTRGAIVETIRGRIDRIDRIRKMEKAEAEERLRKQREAAREDPESMPDPDADPKPEPEPEPEPESGSRLSDAEKAERQVIRELLGRLSEYEETLLFSGAVSRIESFEPETSAGERWKSHLVAGYRQADQFVSTLASLLAEKGYEGVILRREGVPLDARITAATPATFTVDLGFGPNEVDVGAFDPAWMVEAARQLLPSFEEDVAESWEQTVFFALATGQVPVAREMAETIAEADRDFARAWADLSLLLGQEE